jgi:hypothetical protein
MPTPPRKPPARGRVASQVESALKATIESELARAQVDAPNADFSRGAIFSKAGGFSKGIIFSRTSSGQERLDEVVLPSIAQLDDAQFGAFAERLGSLQKVKNLKAQPPTREG